MIRSMCHWPGCTRAAEGYYCGEHGAMAEKRREERKKETRLFEGTRRKASAEYNSLYHSRRWREMRLAFLAENPCCALCGAPASIVDHIEPHRGDGQLFYDEGNLQSLCQSCHSAKTLRENAYFRRSKAR